ncbi:hypothetical protein GCM10010964_44410 [Caldovatus sediminis]|uniref:Uncharacterized protein n=1 Tax=Caldovatus sediminis TaxID=2041189 RepID=A0A8J2ZFQ1_9PROT|nr:hypothetical protein [Caldovatus sediminis]GGG52378.1 hypothetical protein GCM10010964_44410 [Caldovatus sediminis]
MRAAILKRMPIVLVLLSLLVGAPALAASVAPAEPAACGAMDGAATDHHGVRTAPPCNPTAPEPCLAGCPGFAIGCAVVGLPSSGLSIPVVPHGRTWGAGPPGVGAGLVVEPDLFPPILPA